MSILFAVIAVTFFLFLHSKIGKPIPFLRWSFLTLGLNTKRLLREWQVGDGREQACALYVQGHAKAGSIDAAIQAIDEYAYQKKFLINVGDVKGAILDSALERVRGRRVLELGCYVGYSALRMARKLPAGGHVFTIEFSPANAAIARQIISHAGAVDRITVIEGSIGDGGKTMRLLLEKYGFGPGCLDAVFIDHAKDAYLPDLKTLLDAGWLHSGTVVVADNVRFPGAPEYRAYMEQEEGKSWKTTFHKTYAEYQSLIPDLVLESTRL